MSHHSGKIKILKTKDPCSALAKAALPLAKVKALHAKIAKMSAYTSKAQARLVGSILSTTSMRTCAPCRSSQGAAKKVDK
jgi:hypothetical protein